MANFPPRSTARPFGSKIKPVHGKGWADKPTPLGFVGTFLCLWLAVGLLFWAGGLVSERLEDWWVGVWADTPVRHETGADRRVIARGHGWRSNRCDIAVRVNGVPVIFMVDFGAPSFAEFPNSYVKKLNLDPGDYEELWPGTRYGKIAYATVREIRVGDVVWNDTEARIYENWGFSFGNDQYPIFGLAALRRHGVGLEWDGGTCVLTLPAAEAG